MTVGSHPATRGGGACGVFTSTHVMLLSRTKLLLPLKHAEQARAPRACWDRVHRGAIVKGGWHQNDNVEGVVCVAEREC